MNRGPITKKTCKDPSQPSDGPAATRTPEAPPQVPPDGKHGGSGGVRGLIIYLEEER